MGTLGATLSGETPGAAGYDREMTAAPIRVLVVDDDSMAAAGMTAVLSTAPDLEVIGRCADGDEIAAALAVHAVDVVLCDVRMPRMDGVSAVAALRDRAAFLMMTAFDDEGAVLRAIDAGASGFLLKDDDPRRILDAVRSVAAGDAEFSPRVARQLAAWVRDDDRAVARREAQAKVAMLTDRERELAIALVAGASDTELAEAFFIAPSTVKSTLNGIRIKWAIRTRTELAVITVRAGLA